MPKLFILRHAQAESGYSIKDFDRALTDHGIEQAKDIGEFIQDIDIALCSSAKRTQMTLDNAIEGGEPPRSIKILDDLYNASSDELLRSIQSVEGNNILIVAHNPGIHMLAHDLANKSKQSSYLESLSMSYPPATLTILNCDIDHWSALSANENEVVDYILSRGNPHSGA
ncbi:MAG: histidine phosphatase family protein [Pseudomonadota bacterium]